MGVFLGGAAFWGAAAFFATVSFAVFWLFEVVLAVLGTVFGGIEGFLTVFGVFSAVIFFFTVFCAAVFVVSFFMASLFLDISDYNTINVTWLEKKEK